MLTFLALQMFLVSGVIESSDISKMVYVALPSSAEKTGKTYGFYIDRYEVTQVEYLRVMLNNPWFIRFMVRLLQGSSSVIELLESNTFPKNPPKYIQAIAYDYGFSDFETRSRNGPWWNRKLVRPYTLIL